MPGGNPQDSGQGQPFTNELNVGSINIVLEHSKGEGDTEQQPANDCKIKELSESNGLKPESMNIVLDLFKNEYDAEHERASTFEGRSGILITLAGAILAFEAQNFIVPKKGSVASAGLLVAFEIISLALLVASMIALIKVVSTRTFYRVDFEPFRTGGAYYDDFTTVIGTLIETYSDSIKKTERVIETRSRWFSTGLWLLVAGLICVTVSRVMSLYIGG